MSRYEFMSNIGMTEYKPENNVYMDVNHGFGSVLCQLVHGPKTGTMATTPPKPVDPVQAMMSEIFGIPLTDQSLKKKISLISENESRNGPVRKFDFPRLFIYIDPTSRVLQSRTRRANPFFHLYEAMWFLAGRNDVASVRHFVKTISQFSDDGETFNGAYGHRWRQHFGGDQLKTIIQTLKKNPNDRRCVLQMWDCSSDLQGFNFAPENPTGAFDKTVEYSKDVPCNTHCYVQVRNGELDLTVMNRSNDIFWGMLGSNYVTFSFLLEYLAGMIGLPVGMYHHFTANAHYYTEMFPDEKIAEMHDEVDYGVWVPPALRIPLVSTPESFDDELRQFVDNPCGYAVNNYTERFFREIAVPMMYSHKAYKNGDIGKAVEIAKEDINQEDWKVACVDWIVTSKAARKLIAHTSN